MRKTTTATTAPLFPKTWVRILERDDSRCVMLLARPDGGEEIFVIDPDTGATSVLRLPMVGENVAEKSQEKACA